MSEVIIRRVRAQQGAEAAAEPEARGASGALLALEARCKRLRHNLREVLAGHVERRQREVEERQAVWRSGHGASSVSRLHLPLPFFLL